MKGRREIGERETENERKNENGREKRNEKIQVKEGK